MDPKVPSVRPGDIIELDLAVVMKNFISLEPAVIEEIHVSNLETNENYVVEDEPNVASTSEKTRKRVINQKSWKRNVRQRKHQAGEAYTSSRGKEVARKEILNKKNCFANCKFYCQNVVTQTEREELFKDFYSLNQEGKSSYILKSTKRIESVRKSNKSGNSRRDYSFSYFVELSGNMIRVCKPFWLGTFAISQKPVYNAHEKKNSVTGVAKKCDKGLKSEKRIPEDKVSEVKTHITSFPRIESHYCRAKTSKHYLDPNLNITKMYNLYKETVQNPVKESFYRYVFNTNFNLGFHQPKSDRCGKCEAFSVAEKENNLTNEMKEENEIHLKLKQMMRDQKDLDKASGTPILTFDLENVLSCPRAEIGPMFYNSKLNVYNLTAHLSTSKKVYCALWTEYTGGRSGNDIASALQKILEKVFEDSNITKLITWSDSCVPQNKNSIMAVAMQYFMKTHPDVESITMKYSLPGHSALQEVDNAHSQIEKHLSVNEYFSPMGLIRLLKNVNIRNPFVIIQMQPFDVKDFGKYSKICFQYKSVPFSKLKMLRFTQIQYELEYSLDYETLNMTNTVIRRTVTRLRKKKGEKQEVPILQDIETVTLKTGGISQEKSKHLLSMFKYMSSADQAYYKVILKLGMYCN